jgi:methyl-accepting chemotaxis protein
VRALAQRSAQAARKVKTLIGASVEQVIQLIDEMARGTREHTVGFTGIARSVDEIGSATRRSVAAVDHYGQAATRLRQHADSLEQAVAAFNVHVGLDKAGSDTR